MKKAKIGEDVMSLFWDVPDSKMPSRNSQNFELTDVDNKRWLIAIRAFRDSSARINRILYQVGCPILFGYTIWTRWAFPVPSSLILHQGVILTIGNSLISPNIGSRRVFVKLLDHYHAGHTRKALAEG